MTYRALMFAAAVLCAAPAVAQNTWDGNGDLNVNINGRNNALTPTVIVTPSGTQGVNLTQIVGNTAATGNGLTTNGTLRVTLSSDGTGQITTIQPTASLLNATVVGTGTFAVQAIDNITQIGGIAYALGSALSSASAPVVIASDQAAIAIKGAASNAGSGVATSSANAPSIAYNYGFNGTTWDQLQVDASKNLKVNIAAGAVTVTPLALTPVTASAAVESNHVLKASAGTFYGAQVNTTTSAEWVMLFNLTALPSNGAVTPIAFWQVPANSTLSISENPAFTMSTGITIGCSTTGPFTLTASALCTFAGGQVQ